LISKYYKRTADAFGQLFNKVRGLIAAKQLKTFCCDTYSQQQQQHFAAQQRRCQPPKRAMRARLELTTSVVLGYYKLQPFFALLLPYFAG
jgi:hypothetical protein